MTTNAINHIEINNAREYAIKKGKVLEKFTPEFWDRHNRNRQFQQVCELLIRDADPYEVIEKLIEINDDLFGKYHEALMLIPPSNKPLQ